MDILGAYTEKNKKFDKEVKLCQDRNTKNSNRNHELKARLDAVQARTDKLKGKKWINYKAINDIITLNIANIITTF